MHGIRDIGYSWLPLEHPSEFTLDFINLKTRVDSGWSVKYLMKNVKLRFNSVLKMLHHAKRTWCTCIGIMSVCITP